MTKALEASFRRPLPQWAVFAVGLATTVRLEALGFFFGTEILLSLFALDILARRKDTLLRRRVFYALAAIAILCIAIAVTDRLRHVAAADTVKGLAVYVFLGLNLAGTYVICSDDVYRLTALLAGICLGTIMQFAIFGGFMLDINPWKFAYGTPLTILACIAAARLFGISLRTSLLLLCLAGLNLLLDYRSVAGFCFFVAAIVTVATHIRRYFRRPTYKVMLVTVAGMLVLAAAFSAVYRFAATNGYLSSRAEYRYLVQSQAEGGFLVAGRSDLVGALLAIRKSPYVGYGSYAVDPQIARLTIYMMAVLDPVLHYHQPKSENIVVHSYLLGAWVQIGIIGALFWGAWLMLALRATVSAIWLPNSLVAGWLFFLLLEIWNILATPFAGFERLNAAILMNFVLVILSSPKWSRYDG